MSTVKSEIAWRPITRHWLKFNAVGIIGTVLQLAVLTLLTAIFGKPYYLLATLIAVETAILHNFVWHINWTWQDRMTPDGAKPLSTRALLLALLRFNLTTGGVSLIGNLMLMRAFVGGMGLSLIVANLASIATCSLINFILSDRFVFIPKP